MFDRIPRLSQMVPQIGGIDLNPPFHGQTETDRKMGLLALALLAGSLSWIGFNALSRWARSPVGAVPQGTTSEEQVPSPTSGRTSSIDADLEGRAPKERPLTPISEAASPPLFPPKTPFSPDNRTESSTLHKSPVVPTDPETPTIPSPLADPNSNAKQNTGNPKRKPHGEKQPN